MARWAGMVAILCTAVLGAAFVGQNSRMRKLDQELDRARARLEKLESRQRESSQASAAAVDQVREDLARVERKAADAPARGVPTKEGALPTFVTEEDIQKVVDERVEEKLQARGGKGGGQGDGDRKIPLHDLGKELALDPQTQAKVAAISDTVKKEIFEVIKTPRADGKVFADELIDAFLSGEQPAVMKIFQKLFSESVPGSQTTYATAISTLQEKARGELQKAMGPDAYTAFRNMNVNPENIQTGFDPWGEYLQQRGGR
jgi:hypothetical protein